MLKTARNTLFPILAIATMPFGISDDRLDTVLAELKALREQVNQLESRLESLENQPTESIAGAAPQAQTPNKTKWIDDMRIELKKADARASGAWTKAASWTGISKGMKEEAVVALLGEPTDRKFSVRKDTDEILIYQGDLTGSGEPIVGEVRIYKGKVRRFSVPDLPQE